MNNAQINAKALFAGLMVRVVVSIPSFGWRIKWPTCAASLLLVLIGFATATPINAQVHDATPLELSGYSLSEAYDIEDDQPLNLESPHINKLLYRIKKTSPQSRHEYQGHSKNVTWEKITTTPEDYRCWVFQRRLTLKKVTKHRFVDAAKDTEIKGVFICHCENDLQQPVTVLSRTMPRKLRIDTELNEPISINGFLFARSKEAAEAKPKMVFVVDRIAWFPSTEQAGIATPSHVKLASAGVDIGLLDWVEESNTRRLGNRDSEAFYQMIAAMKKTSLGVDSPNPLSFVDLMQNASTNFGDQARIKGVVRSVTEVFISNPDIKQRLGVSRYYQLMMFPDLDGGKIVVKNKSGDDLEYRRFPITVCCLELPEGMTASEIERKPMVVEGFFFRFWKYQSDLTDTAGTSGQVSPLIIAKSPTIIESQESRLNLILLIFVSALIAGVAILLWTYRIVDRRQKSPGQKILETLPDKLDLTGVQDN